MLLEINHAATHILSWLKKHSIFLSSDDLSESFVLTFSRLLTDKYTGHWDPNYPILGNGFRSVSVYNGRLDSVLRATSNALGLDTDFFASMLPFNFVLWVDPMEVSFRKGEHGYPSVIWRQKHTITFRPKRASPLRTISLKQPDMEVSEPGKDSVMSARMMPWFDLCSYKSINIPAKIEPSDLAFGNDRVYLVSDNGRLLIFDATDKLLSEIKIAGKPDLEGVAADPADPFVLYLGVEYPPSILVFDLKSKKISKTLELPNFFQFSESHIDQNKGLESIAYHVSDDGKKYFLVGRQSDALVFVYEYEKSTLSIKFKNVFTPPGPKKDLSAITIWNDRLWFLYDKGKEMTAVKLQELNSDKKVFIQDPSVGTFTFEMRGLEGITFANWNGTIWVYVAIDPPKKFGENQLLKYSLKRFLTCFGNDQHLF